MRDGLSELAAIIIAVIVLVFLPLLLNYAKTEIITEGQAESMIYRVQFEANSNEELSLAEMEHLLRVAAVQKNPLRIVYFGMEGVSNGNFGEYIYRVEDKQLYRILEENGEISMPEGSILGVYR